MKLEEILPLARATGRRIFNKNTCNFFTSDDEAFKDCWELESQSITITEEQFDAAWGEAVGINIRTHLGIDTALKKELGFK